MVSSFYLGLSNSGPKEQSTVGSDFAPQRWVQRSLSTTIKEVRRALFISPHLPEAINWRTAEICRIIERIDLVTMLAKFEMPMGYESSTLTVAMANRFEISFADPTFTSKFSLQPRIRTPSYQLHDLVIQVGEEDWRVTFDGESQSGPIGGKDLITVTIYGQHSLTFDASRTGIWQTRFASPPLVSLADTSRTLRQELRPMVYDLLKLPSTLPDGTLSFLKQILDKPQDPAITVCAVAIAIAGATLASPAAE